MRSSLMSTLSMLIRGTPGHPLHPPLTDATIGMFVLAAALAVIGYAGGLGSAAGKAMWLALVGGLIVAAPTALTGFADWLTLEWGSRRWRTATVHMLAMVTSVCLFAAAAWLQWRGWRDGVVTGSGLVLTLSGLCALVGGGWLGGSLVFVHGVRVLEREESSGVASPANDPAGDSASLVHVATGRRSR
jgi:uncharacterized membrane protein